METLGRFRFGISAAWGETAMSRTGRHTSSALPRQEPWASKVPWVQDALPKDAQGSRVPCPTWTSICTLGSRILTEPVEHRKHTNNYLDR